MKHLIVLSGRLFLLKNDEKPWQGCAIPAGEVRLIAATGRYLGEGFDDPQLDTLILACLSPGKGSSYSTRAGFIGNIREHEVRVYDYVDVNVPKLLRMHRKRLRGFRDIGYTED